MSDSNIESDGMILSKDEVDSPPIDEGSCGGSMSGGVGSGLKKGPWTAAEDAILVDYVKKHGEGNWNAVQKHSGLFRCGKSCRLRWANHLRPNLKKGAFTAEEERIIIELHARLGNKWARMAASLPGRTDNEIKNYWNTRIKRRQRAGLPLYPSDVRARVSEDSQSQSIEDFSAGDKQHNEVLQGNVYAIPEVYEDYKNNPGALFRGSTFPDISFSNMLSQGFGSQSYGPINPSVNNKRFREPESFFPGSLSSRTLFGNFPNGPSENISRPFDLSCAYDPEFFTKNTVSYGGPISGSHCPINGNFSASRTIPGPVKLELPSLQDHETDIDGWFSQPSPPETIDPYIHSPLQTVSLQSECTSPRNSGLLEDLLHESLKKQSVDKSANSSEVAPSDMVDSSTGWDGCNDPTSPLGFSAASVFNEFTPTSGGGSLDDLLPCRGHSGLQIMMPNTEHVSTPNATEMDIKPRPDFLRPDALLGSAWLMENSRMTKEHNDMNNALAALLGDDLGSEHNQVPAGPSPCSQGMDLDSFPWNNMPRVCQISELP